MCVCVCECVCVCGMCVCVVCVLLLLPKVQSAVWFIQKQVIYHMLNKKNKKQKNTFIHVLQSLLHC